LAGLPDELLPASYTPFATRDVAEDFAADQERMRAIRREYGYDHGLKGQRAASVDTFDFFEPNITDALRSAGLHWGHLYALKLDGLERFIDTVPLMFTHRELRRLRQEASPKPWEGNDLADLGALGPAIVYCDVVVTENVWTAFARRAKLGERFNVTVLSRLSDLMPHLIEAPLVAD
jgi:hypothetical protein